ncbi:uncharacterized protein LOC112086626 [Eutrema salsugineum]|uniref:uncharacterized protein LOC112086626 n=1 Tax=Eutrema salsugineum TaxID=72664 RepID=UPI000CED2612|nr:uncharacterized protein LOC112086626 [Eutrema salsugineum]
MEGSVRYKVHSVHLEHTCSVDVRWNYHRQATYTVIGDLMRAKYGVEGKGPRAFELRRLCRQEFSLHISYWKAWRALEIAMDRALGSAMGSYALVPAYFKIFLEANPNLVVGLKTETDPSGVESFKYLFFSVNACARGYRYMRKVIVIDGTHFRNRYGGCLVAASAQDGNFQVFPLGFAVVDSENDDAWEWFLWKLTEIVPEEPDLVFVSDRHSSIYTAIRKVYLMSSHGAYRAYRLSEFDRIFEEIRNTDPECAAYLARIDFEHWTRSHFVGDRYNIMTSNISESLNYVLTMARDFPVISILETIRTTLVSWFALRREAANKDTDIMNPKVKEMMMENFKKSAGYFIMKIGDGIYEVRDAMDIAYAVHLWEQSCTCRAFQLLGIPCEHAIAAGIRDGVRVETLVNVHYTVQYRRLAYEAMIMPVPDMDTLERTTNESGKVRLGPPNVRRPPGRPKKTRIFSKGEFKRVARRRCTRCRVRGHNKSTCKGPIPVRM